MFFFALLVLGFLVCFIAYTYDRDPKDRPVGSRSYRQDQANKSRNQEAVDISTGTRAGVYLNNRNVH